MDTNAEAFVSGECPTPSRQARCGQRRNAWERRGRMSDTEPLGEVRATPQCVETTWQHVRHRAVRRGAGNAAMRGNDVAECPTPSRQARCGQRRNAWEHALLTLTYMNDFQEEE